MRTNALFLPYLLFILFGFLLPMLGWTQDDCAPVNLVTEANSPFSRIPVYNQEKINICYAYSAAQMVDFHLMKTGVTTKSSVHPAWVALNYAKKKDRHQLEIGHTKEALEALAESSNCDAEVVSLALRNWAQRNDVTEARILTYIERNSPKAPGQREPGSLPGVNDLRIANISSVQLLANLLTTNCQARQAITLPKAHKYNFLQLPDDNAFASALKGKLAALRSPLSIAYCSNIWKNPEYRGIGLTASGVRDSLKKDCHYHESLVVGRKELGGSCHLLVRNTWGTNWTAENKGWKCVCRNKVTGDYAEECAAETHPSDQFSVEACWLPSENLARNTGLITTLE